MNFIKAIKDWSTLKFALINYTCLHGFTEQILYETLYVDIMLIVKSVMFLNVTYLKSFTVRF